MWLHRQAFLIEVGSLQWPFFPEVGSLPGGKFTGGKFTVPAFGPRQTQRPYRASKPREAQKTPPSKSIPP
jgi:hypothetical protein